MICPTRSATSTKAMIPASTPPAGASPLPPTAPAMAVLPDADAAVFAAPPAACADACAARACPGAADAEDALPAPAAPALLPFAVPAPLPPLDARTAPFALRSRAAAMPRFAPFPASYAPCAPSNSSVSSSSDTAWRSSIWRTLSRPFVSSATCGVPSDGPWAEAGLFPALAEAAALALRGFPFAPSFGRRIPRASSLFASVERLWASSSFTIPELTASTFSAVTMSAMEERSLSSSLGSI